MNHRFDRSKRRVERAGKGGSNCRVEPLESRTLLSVDVLTYHYNNARTGANTAETTLTPANVSTNFGKLFSLPVDGYVYAQPLLKTKVAIHGQGVHDVVYVATEHDSVYAFDAQGHNPARGYLWKDSFINPAAGVTTVPYTDTGTNDIVPEIGITSTPVIDPATNTLYVLAKTKEVINGVAHDVQRLHALDLTTGAEKAGGPTVIRATVPGTGDGTSSVSFNPATGNQRAALALVNGVVYIAWASHGDNGPYHGWVIGYQASNISRQVAAFNDTPNGSQGGIWMSGGGISADASNNIYFGTGNGTFDANTGGADYGDTSLKLSTAGGLSVADYFTPDNQQNLGATDHDFGVSDSLILPDQANTTHPHELLTADKSGRLYLINRDRMGRYNAATNNDLGEITLGVKLHNTIAYFNGHIYVGGDSIPLQAFSMVNGVLGTRATSATSNIFGNGGEDGQGTGPLISANGTSNAIVWALDNSNYAGNGAAVLHAYDANNLSRELYDSSTAAQGRDNADAAVKFTSPVVANGLVYVPGESSVTVYGLLPPPPPVPAPYTDADIGRTGVAGSALYTGSTNTWRVAGGGADIWGTVDAFNFVSEPYLGNGTLVARVASMSNTDPAAKSGVMFRANSSPNAAFADTVVTVARGVSFQWRTAAGGPVHAVIIPGVAAPIYLSLTRTGSSFSAAYSKNGTTWTAIGKPQTISMTSPVLAGLAVTSHHYGVLNTSVFTNYSDGRLPPVASHVSLASSFNRLGIVTDGSTFTGGLDGGAAALSAKLLGTSPHWDGQTFALGAPNTSDVVSATGQTIRLAGGSDSQLLMLADGVDGNQPGQVFTVHYSDGSSTTFTQGISDWFTPQGYPGEANAITMPYRDLSTGGTDNRPFHVYGYVFQLNSGKKIASITLPSDTNVEVLAMDLVP